MKKIAALFLAALLLIPALCAPSPAGAEDGEKVFRVGQELPLFEKDGLSVRLAGGVVMLDISKTLPAIADVRDDNAAVALTAVVENNSDKNLFLEYTGSVNGIAIGGGNHSLPGVHVLSPGSRNAAYIAFGKDWLNGADVRTLEKCDLTFRVYEKPTNLNDDNILLYEVPAGVIRFDRAPAAGLSFREGESLVVLAQNGLQIALSTMQVAKGSTYVIMGGKATNNTGKTISIRYAAKVNGWDIGGLRSKPLDTSMKSAETIVPGVTELIMPVTLSGWMPIRANTELESLDLTFEISEADGSGKETPWFTSSTGTIWINRTAGTGEAAPAKAAAVTEAPTPVPTPEPEERKEFSLMFGLAFGDSKATVKDKISAGGGSAYEESGALHGNAALLDLPNKSYDYLFSSNGKLSCIRNVYLVNGEKPALHQKDYKNVRMQLVEFFGAPNGRGPTEVLRSSTDLFSEVVMGFMSGPYYKCLQHDEWYLPDTKPYPLKIDLFFEETGNTETGDFGTVIEVDIEARGV